MEQLKKLVADLEEKIIFIDQSEPSVSAASVGWHIQHTLLVITQIIKVLKSSDPSRYKKKFNFTTAPNPAIHNFNVTLGDEFLQADAQMIMYNIQGNIILNRRMATPSEMIDVSGFARGLYFVKIVQGEKTAIQKVILNE